MAIMRISDSTISTQSEWIEEGKYCAKSTTIATLKHFNNETVHNSQVKQSKIKEITTNTIKLYQNNLTKDTMVKQIKLYLKWKTYYKIIKITIFGEK